MKIGISFKETEKDLYDFVVSQLSPSIYMKQLIKNDMEKDKSESKGAKNRIELDF